MSNYIILRAYEEDCEERIEIFKNYALLSGAELLVSKEKTSTYVEEYELFKLNTLDALAKMEEGEAILYVGRDVILKNASSFINSYFEKQDKKSISIPRGTKTLSLSEFSVIKNSEKTINFLKNLNPLVFEETISCLPNLTSFVPRIREEQIMKINLQLLEGKIDVEVLKEQIKGWTSISGAFSEDDNLEIRNLSKADIITRNIIAKKTLSLQDKELFKYESRNKEFAIVTIMDSNAEPCLDEFKKSYLKYCEKHDFSLYIFKKPHKENITANWSKAFYMKSILKKYKNVMWVDTDTIVLNYETDALDFLKKSELDVIFFEDAANTREHRGVQPHAWDLNSGVFLMKKSKCSTKLMSLWAENIQKVYKDNGNKIQSVYTDGGDQHKLIMAYKKLQEEFKENIEILPCDVFNVHPKFIDEKTCVAHFMGYGNYSIRALIMSEYNKSFSS